MNAWIFEEVKFIVVLMLGVNAGNEINAMSLKSIYIYFTSEDWMCYVNIT